MELSELHETIKKMRELGLDKLEIRVSSEAVWSEMVEAAGVRLIMSPRSRHVSIGSFFGIPIVFDPYMSPGMVLIRERPAIGEP